MIEPATLLKQAVPGIELRQGPRYVKLTRTIPQAWRIWRGNGTDWAVFLVVGDHLSETDQTGIALARRAGATPVIVIPDFSGVRAISALYRKLRPHLICDIAGRGALISPPPRFQRRGSSVATTSTTRISPDLFEDLIHSDLLTSRSQATLKVLLARYRRMLAPRGDTDAREAAALMQFAERALEDMGLRKDRIKTTRMLHTIERGGLTHGGRDHFFHSFQNYFLGLRAVVELRPQFEAFKEAAKLNWDINPIDVWFLTALWHDVGYGVQHVGTVVDAVLGDDDTDDIGDSLKERFLQRPATDDALRLMSSLVARLLSTERPLTGWLSPGPKTNLGHHANQLRQAFQQNVLSSHGAASAVRLFCDHRDDLDKMDPGVGEILKQTVYLASCSIPFHDWKLRKAIRDVCGRCQFETIAMPFGALLAFVDSIQDDRRDLGASQQAVLILKRVLVRRPALVEADIDLRAIPDEGLLGKMIEARDVLGTLKHDRDGLRFKYPSWMSGLG